MRTTLDIDDDLLSIAEERARQQCKPTGQVVSELIRQALQPQDALFHNGIQVLPRRPGVVVTMEMVNRLRDE
jgi:hypothetical protein